MYTLDAIEAINVDQLVTPLDRILLRSGNVRRTTRRSFDLTHQAALAVAASKKRRDDNAGEKTQYMRAQRAGRGAVGVAAALACATWLSVAVACLLA
jgi:hypothetical protein